MKQILLLLSLFASFATLSQQTEKINQLELIQDMQIWNKDDGRMRLAFWIPNCYWRIVLEENPAVDEQTIEKIETIFEDYVVICALDAEILPSSLNYVSFEEMQEDIVVSDKNGGSHPPLSEEVISLETYSILSSIKPMFDQMFGQMGEGMHFYLFEIKDEKGKNLIDEREKGQFTVSFSQKEFNWMLPLPSLMPKLQCPTDNKEMKGNWTYCPFHGVKLVKSDVK